jgi:hypothetical protein
MPDAFEVRNARIESVASARAVIQWTDADKETHMDMSIAGERVRITGASQGIGEGIFAS